MVLPINRSKKCLVLLTVKTVVKALVISVVTLAVSTPLWAALPSELDCLVKPEVDIELSSPIDSVVEKILVKPGDTITKGQALVQLQASVERARVKLAQQQSRSSSEINNRKVQLRYAQLNNQRVQDLYANKSVSQFEYDKSATELALAEIELSKARDKKEVAHLNLELAQAQLSLKTIYSPIDGIVADIYAAMGESVIDRPLMKLAQIDPLKVEVIAPTEYFGLITTGMEAHIRPEYPVNKAFKAKVTMVDQLIDSASGSFTVRIALPNPDDQLVAGVNCVASFELAP
ncbi:MAG: RND family efflux transporter MFP subunit [Pseudohongiellaceae bacterium]|jgi:RND family efflux transporter MFP subunit